MQPLGVNLVVQYLIQSPQYLVWLVGLVLVVRNWQRYPRPALLTLIALVILVLRALMGGLLSAGLPMIAPGNMSNVGILVGLTSIIQSLLGAVAYALLLTAIFGWREERVG